MRIIQWVYFIAIIGVFYFIETFSVGLTNKNYQLEIKATGYIAINFHEHVISFRAAFFSNYVSQLCAVCGKNNTMAISF